MRIVGCIAIVLVMASLPAAAGTLVGFERPEPYALQVEGIELSGQTRVEIEAVGRRTGGGHSWFRSWWGGDHDNERDMTVYAWILDGDTREPVWVMDPDDSERLSAHLLRAEHELQLEPGRYEFYFFSGHPWYVQLEQRRDEDQSWWERMFSDNRNELEQLKEDLEECYFTVSADGLSASTVKRFDATGELPSTLVRHAAVGDSYFDVTGFELERQSRLQLYGVIEWPKDDRAPADYGWIVDAETRELVWHPSQAHLFDGGGGKKNRLIDEELELEPGRYLLYFGTDDSHSVETFNVQPPYDPFNWGLSVLAGDGFDADGFRTFEPQDPGPAPIAFTRAGDREHFEQAFRLGQDATVLVHALGEHVDGDSEFADYAWIVDAASGRIVWEMTPANTMGAGGADKNRMFDGPLELSAGDYVVYYVTDGSHAWETWNGATPFQPDAWGVTVRPGPGLRRDGIRPIALDELAASDDYLVRLVRIGDDESVRERFTLEQAAEVRIYALGEGRSGAMYDYGYIVDDRTGRTVWEMTYDASDHAGGADKNRMVDELVHLEPGTYQVVYVTDDSHSFDGWNARRPRDPLSWGVTVRVARR